MLLPIIFTILIFPGIFMTIVPMMPALPYMFLMAVIFGLFDGFVNLTLVNLGVLGGILIASILIDYFSGIIGAKYSGASKKGLLFGFLGLILGFIFLPPFGGFVGLFVGILIAEFIIKGNEIMALKTAAGSLIGIATGIFINILLAIAFFVLFVLFLFLLA
jgi:hypothetical protein|tara:strand:+ start:37857 stop:38339 length:483 start_codon:yes stop_codon:yes gene_type:complete